MNSTFRRAALALAILASLSACKPAADGAPVVALSAVQLGFLLGGSVVIETIFAIDGLGYLAYRSITQKDFPVIQVIVLMLSFIYVLLTLLADLANAWLDPRIRVS